MTIDERNLTYDISQYIKEEQNMLNNRFYKKRHAIENAQSYIAGMKRILRLCNNSECVLKNIELLDHMDNRFNETLNFVE